MGLNQEEEFLPIKDFDNYFISNLGRVKNSAGKILNQRVEATGYCRVELWKNNKRKVFLS